MRGHVRQRGSGWSFVVDVEGQRAQRCAECGVRHWVERERPVDACDCGGRLSEPQPERRQLWRSGFTTRKAAEKALRDFMTDLDAGADPFPVETDLRTWAERWKASPAFGKLRQRTRSRYAQMLADWWLEHLGSMRVDRIRARHIRSVLDAMATAGVSARSIAESKAIISSCLARAVDVGLIDANPAAGIRVSAGRRARLAVPTTEQVDELLAVAEGTTWDLPLALAAYTGMRRGEVMGLQWGNVDLDERTIRVTHSLHRVSDADGSRLVLLDTKTETSTREFMVASSLVERLRSHRREQNERRLTIGPGWQNLDLVCDRGDGGPLDPDSFSHGFKRAVAAAGLPQETRLHDIRHSVATTLLRSGVDAKIVSSMLGHSTVSFTQDQYQHVIRSMTAPAAEALDAALGGGSPVR
jgi:integrase